MAETRQPHFGVAACTRTCIHHIVSQLARGHPPHFAVGRDTPTTFCCRSLHEDAHRISQWQFVWLHFAIHRSEIECELTELLPNALNSQHQVCWGRRRVRRDGAQCRRDLIRCVWASLLFEGVNLGHSQYGNLISLLGIAEMPQPLTQCPLETWHATQHCSLPNTCRSQASHTISTWYHGAIQLCG